MTSPLQRVRQLRRLQNVIHVLRSGACDCDLHASSGDAAVSSNVVTIKLEWRKLHAEDGYQLGLYVTKQ